MAAPAFLPWPPPPSRMQLPHDGQLQREYSRAAFSCVRTSRRRVLEAHPGQDVVHGGEVQEEVVGPLRDDGG